MLSDPFFPPQLLALCSISPKLGHKDWRTTLFGHSLISLWNPPQRGQPVDDIGWFDQNVKCVSSIILSCIQESGLGCAPYMLTSQDSLIMLQFFPK